MFVMFVMFKFCVEHCHTVDKMTVCRTVCASDTIPNLKLVPDVKEGLAVTLLPDNSSF